MYPRALPVRGAQGGSAQVGPVRHRFLSMSAGCRSWLAAAAKSRTAAAITRNHANNREGVAKGHDEGLALHQFAECDNGLDADAVA